MKSIYNNLTIFFVAYHSDYSFEKLIKKINKKIKIIIIENSNLSETKIYFEKKYKNVKVILSSKNGGQTGGFNLGLKNIKTKYALYLDMDVNFDNSIIKNFYDSAEKIKDFIILAPEHHKSGYPIKFIHELNKINDVKTRMRIIHGHFMFFNMNNVKKVGLFDKKIFMYYEETDYCLRSIKKGQKIYILNGKKVDHKDAKSYRKDLLKKIEPIRQWHIMWSKLYFYKKHYGIFRAITELLPDFVKSLIKLMVLYFINNHKYEIHKYRLLGIAESLLNKDSWRRIPVK
jgi:hypothetical protein